MHTHTRSPRAPSHSPKRGHLSQANPDYRHPYLVKRDIKRVGYIIITTDRGLTGSLNVNEFRVVVNDLRKWQAEGVAADLCIIGAKGVAYFRRLNTNIVAAATHIGEVPHVADLVGAIAGESGRAGGDVGAIEIADRFSLVEVPAPAADEVIEALRRTTIKGRRPTVRRDRSA